ncbi:MAG: hypothetical protein NTAFB05_05600 [Nitrobacter sp.]|uniref:polysaccharide deacetylase family protein n=1 Tax=Nitrobacter sp. TaxID=29420 RepID=UPI00387DD677
MDLSADAAADLGNLLFQRPARTRVLLTHDIDSAECPNNLVKWFLPIEESNDVRSANYIVPRAWPIDRGLTSEIDNRGHEIGIHGYDHSNRTPFAPTAERHVRLAAGAQVGTGFKTAGYRAPSLVRTKVMIEELASHYSIGFESRETICLRCETRQDFQNAFGVRIRHVGKNR